MLRPVLTCLIKHDLQRLVKAQLFNQLRSESSQTTKIKNVFHYYGPAGLYRRKGETLELFHLKEKKWIKTDNPILHKAVIFDSKPITEAQALEYQKKIMRNLARDYEL